MGYSPWGCKESDTTERRVQSLGSEDPLKKEMATHSSMLAGRIPWTEEARGLHHGVVKSQTQLSMHAIGRGSE